MSSNESKQTQQDNPNFGTEGIIGNYDPVLRGWWFKGENPPRFKPVPEEVTSPSRRT